MAELHWFPLYFEDWLTSRSITAMLPEQEGAYIRLLMHAWGDGSHEPWLEANDAKLAAWSRLGSRWRKLGAAIVAEFIERDGKLYNERLSTIWQEQQEKHATAVVKAKKAVATRETKRKARQAEIDASREYPGDHLQDGSVDDLGDHPGDAPEVEHLKLDVVVEPVPKGTGVLPSTAPNRALAPNGARAPGAEVRTSVLDLQQRAMSDEYQRRLYDHADRWREESDAHRAQWTEFEIIERRSLGRPAMTCDAVRTGSMVAQTLYSGVVERSRLQEKWPSRDEWAKARSRELPEIVGAA